MSEYIKKSHHVDDYKSTQYNTNTYDTKPPYEVNIDFDGASKAWRRNKQHVGQSKSMFQYVCGEPRYNGDPCHGTPFHHAASLRIKDSRGKYQKTWAPCRRHRTQEQLYTHMSNIKN